MIGKRKFMGWIKLSNANKKLDNIKKEVDNTAKKPIVPQPNVAQKVKK